MKIPAYIIDIDGTVALRATTPGARGPYDWARVDEDLPNIPLIDILKALHAQDPHTQFLFTSGRSEVCFGDTVEWLRAHGLPVHTIYMRPLGDGRPDYELKSWIYRESIAPYFRVLAVFDDRNSVVSMWRYEYGLTVLQVAEGDF
jgi:hypothetical protein